MTPFFAGLTTGVLLGAIAFGLFALVLLIHRKPPSITMHARRDHHEFVHRKYRDAEIVATVAETEPVEPIYMYGVTGLEDV